MKLKQIALFVLTIAISIASCAQNKKPNFVEYNDVTCGAERLDLYIPQLKNKKVAIVANQSSNIGKTHLVDSLFNSGVAITKIFCPEHGFRGKADAGETIVDGSDSKTGIPIISLYGSHKKPTPKDLADVDIVIFDLQDVGTRFYTYISTLTYVMEACAEENIPIIVLDRPNPNGYYVDGPILENENSSFVGLHPVPIVYGMTIGEYAKMVAGENWINESTKLELEVVSMNNYNHNMIVSLQIKPSPNLPNWQSVYLYPSLCLFEGTIMSIGRGTDTPFQIYGHPKFMIGSYAFTPESIGGASSPKFKGQHCFGINLTGYAENFADNESQINLTWLISSYELMNKQDAFFTKYFEKLAGTANLRKQINDGLTEAEIRKSWQPGLDKFNKIRSKYLLYD